MRLFAISDLHLGFRENWEAFQKLGKPPREKEESTEEDWLILAGDIGEEPEHLLQAIEVARHHFEHLVWVPGNHELWTLPTGNPLRGEARYLHLVNLCRKWGVQTPEDPYPEFSSGNQTYTLAPLFLLYDYSFRPDSLSESEALPWAMEQDLLCADEAYLHPDPYPTKQAWCKARAALTRGYLERIPRSHKIILVNHFPLRQDQVDLPFIPRFSIWCGTKLTESWHRDFNVEMVVYGHLHYRSSSTVDGVRFEEVSLGYPRHWKRQRSINSYLRRLL